MFDMVNMSTVAPEPEFQTINTTTIPNIGMVCKYIPLYLMCMGVVKNRLQVRFLIRY
jgi:hypothetical protein